MSDDLPEGWLYSKLGELAEVKLGKMLDKGRRREGRSFPYLRNANVRWGNFDLRGLFEMPFAEDELQRFSIRNGDLLVCEGGEPGRCAVWLNGDTEIRFQKALLRARTHGAVISHWIMYALRLAVLSGRLEGYCTGTTIRHFPRESAVQFALPVPPLPEQRRIVSKVEILFARVNAARERLEKVPVLLKRFRQSVLDKAFRGDLVPEGRSLRPASELVDGASEAGLDELPDGWSAIPLDQLLQPGGIFDGPFGSNLKTADYTSCGVRVIRLENIANLQFVSNKETWISHSKYERLKRHSVAGGDIVFGSFVDEFCRVCLLPELSTPAIVKADCFCIRPDGEVVDRRFLAYQLGSPSTRNALVQEIHGATRPRINIGQLRALTVVLPPITEQRRIAARIDTLLAFAAAVEEAVARARAVLARAPQAILQKAFAGELVPTEAELAAVVGREFESTEALLRRVATQTAATAPPDARPRRWGAQSRSRKTTSGRGR